MILNVKSVVLNLWEELKYEAGKWCQLAKSQSKCQASCWIEGMGPTELFVHLIMIHTHAESCACMHM